LRQLRTKSSSASEYTPGVLLNGLQGWLAWYHINSKNSIQHPVCPLDCNSANPVFSLGFCFVSGAKDLARITVIIVVYAFDCGKYATGLE
jgi:hypothetical protein